MATIYDSFQLTNSQNTRPFIGSTLGELNKVSDVLQQRYDTSVLGMDAMSEFMKQAKALPKDQPLLKARLNEYQTKIKEWSGRKDLENVPQDVMRASRQLAGEYRNFSENYQKAAEYNKQLDDLALKGPGQGGVSRKTAEQLKAKSMDEYSNLQYDPQTGRYSGGFSGESIAPEVDTAAWIKKVAGDVAASKNSSLVESDGGLYFVTRGGERKEVNFERDLKPAIQRAYALDTEIQSDFKQRAGLAGWQSKNVKLKDIPNKPEFAAVRQGIKDLTDRGIPEDQAVRSIVAESTQRDLYKTLEDFGRKYAFVEKGSSFTIGEKTIAGEKAAKKALEPDSLLALAYSTPGAGVGPKTVGEVETLISTSKTNAQALTQEYTNFMKGKTFGANGRVLGKDENGTLKDMTVEHNQLTNRMLATNKESEQLESVKKAAAYEAKFNPTEFEKKVQPEAEKLYNQSKEAYKKEGIWVSGDTGTGGGGGYVEKNPSAKQIEDAATAVKNRYIQQKMQDNPGFKAYEKILAGKLNPAAESSTLVMIQDPVTKKAWSDNLTAMASDLGLEQGAIRFTIGGGPDQGKDITASQYDQLKGNLDVIGFDTDKSGQTILKVRAFKNVQGKKTEGADILLNLGNTSVDEYLQKEMKPEQFMQFKGVGQIKSVLNNSSRSGDITIPGTDQKANIKPKNGKWVVTLPNLPGRAMPTETPAESYEGVLDVLLKASAIINGR